MPFSEPTQRWVASGRFVEVPGHRLFVVERGQGPVLLLVHGFPTSSYDYRALMQRLAPRFRCIAFDFPGYGLSDKPVAYSYSLFQQADALEALLAALEVRSCRVVCHDMGTSVMTELLARRLEGRLEGRLEDRERCTFEHVTFTNGSMLQWRADITPFQKLLASNETLFQGMELSAKLGERLAGGLRSLMRRPEVMTDEDELVMRELTVHLDGHLRLPALAGYMRERYLYKERWIGALQQSAGQISLVWAMEDPIANLAMGRELHALLPQAPYLELDGVGHFVIFEDPERVAAAIFGRVTTSDQNDARALANAALLGWLPLVVVNAVFARRVPVVLDLGQIALHHFYDAGQMLGLGLLSWLVVRGLARVPLAVRVFALIVLLVLVERALLAEDLESFIQRHPKKVPWHLVFSAIGAVGVAASFALGHLLARSRLRFAGVALGLAMAVANHLVLPLAYRGAHFTLAWCAAALIGMSVWRDVGALQPPRRLRVGLALACLLSLLTYAIPASAVVRGALLGSSGATAAPFVNRLWVRLQGEPEVPAHLRNSPWFKPRRGLPAIPPERMPSGPSAPLVIMLTIDAARGDLFDGPNARKDALPNLMAMRERSLHFERVWAPAAYTMASLRSLFYGGYYLQHPSGKSVHQRRAMGQRPGVPKGPYLAQVLNDGGVATLTFRSSKMFATKGGVCRGFAEEVRLRSNWATDVVAAVLDRLKTDARRPLFVYAHLMDPHEPYTRGGEDGTPFENYVAEVSKVDKQIGKLRRELASLGLDRETYLIVTADHAEAFGEHGHFFHARNVYEEMIRIPMFVEGPGVQPRLVKRAVSLIDLGPTILSLFGLPTPGHYMGQSLVPFMRGENPQLSRPLAVDNGGGMRAMLFEQRWKAILNHGNEEVYDLRTDPGETRNLADLPQSRIYLATLRAFFKGLNPKADNAKDAVAR